MGLLVAWVIATAAATMLASQAVALVRDQVTDRPSRVATTLALETTTSAAAAPEATTQPSASSTSTSLSEMTTTTTPVGSPPTTRTTVATTPAPTTTTTTKTTNQEQTFYLIGGWASVGCTGNQVALATYAPNPGYHVEIESAGPSRLEIKFEESGGDHESKLDARCDNGILDPRIDEHNDH